MEMKNVKANNLFNGIKKALDTNAPTIATFGSVLGVGLTIFFMHRASKNAAKIEEKYEEDMKYVEADLEDDHGNPASEDDIKAEKTRLKIDKYLRLVYIYRWALLSGIGSAGFAILSNYLNGRTIATITGLLALNNEKLKEYAKKGKEMLGEEKFQEMKESVERDILGKKLEKGDLKIEKADVPFGKDDGPDPGFERYYVPFWGEIYDIPAGRIKDAIAEAERMEFLDYNTWRGMLGLDSCTAGYKFKWDRTNPFKAHIGYVNMGVGGMKAICYDNEPDFNTMGK